jgi:hypothetical protein
VNTVERFHRGQATEWEILRRLLFRKHATRKKRKKESVGAHTIFEIDTIPQI